MRFDRHFSDVFYLIFGRVFPSRQQQRTLFLPLRRGDGRIERQQVCLFSNFLNKANNRNNFLSRKLFYVSACRS